MKGWENNVLKYIEEKQVGLCPECGSDNIKVEEHHRGTRRSISFICGSCGSGDHFDGFTE